MKGTVHHLLTFAACVGASFAAAAIGSLFTAPSIPGWYAGIVKPSWTPPGWLFGPVWSLLYLMMGVAAWLVWRKAGFHAAALPLALFCLQLLLNARWSILFFGLRSPGTALLEIVFLWGAILATTLAFFRHSAPAGWLMLPYLAWVTFAAALNASIWHLNR
jgi:tryptophan-rich sensory protein